MNDRIRQALQSRSCQNVSASGILLREDYYDFLRQHVTGLLDKDLASLTVLLDMQADVSFALQTSTWCSHDVDCYTGNAVAMKRE